MSELKTTQNDGSVLGFIDTLTNDAMKQDCLALLDIFEKATGEQPRMWGTSIIGYGSYHYKSERSRQEGDWMLTGFSPRKQGLTIYIMPGFDKYGAELAKLGKYTNSVSCLYIKKLSDVDTGVLSEIIRDAAEVMRYNSTP